MIKPLLHHVESCVYTYQKISLCILTSKHGALSYYGLSLAPKLFSFYSSSYVLHGNPLESLLPDLVTETSKPINWDVQFIYYGFFYVLILIRVSPKVDFCLFFKNNYVKSHMNNVYNKVLTVNCGNVFFKQNNKTHKITLHSKLRLFFFSFS